LEAEGKFIEQDHAFNGWTKLNLFLKKFSFNSLGEHVNLAMLFLVDSALTMQAARLLGR
jgi:hypothetical protein